MMSVTSRSDGRGGKMYSFWAWYSLSMSFWRVPPRRFRSVPAASAHLAHAQRVVGVAAHQGGEVVGHRQAFPAGAEDVVETGVGVLGRPEPGEHPHGPQLGPVHRGIRPPCVGEDARPLAGGPLAGSASPSYLRPRPVDRLEGDPRHRLEVGVPEGGLGIGLLPLRESTHGMGFLSWAHWWSA